MNAQVAINTTGNAPDGNAMLDIASTTKGILIPRVALSDRPATPTTGLLIYQTDNIPGFYYFDGTTWVRISTGVEGWALKGNTNTTAGTDFLGTTDNKDVVFKTNGTEYMRLNGENDAYIGYLGIGTNDPKQRLQVTDDILLGAASNGGTPDGNAEGIKIWNSNSAWFIGVDNSSDEGSLSSDENFFIGHNDDSDGEGIFNIQYDGRIGIGTTSPASWAKLEIEVHDTDDALYLQNTNATSNTDAIFRIDANSSLSNAFRVQRNGKVGINVPNPSHNLTVYSSDSETMRLFGSGTNGCEARLNFGDGDYVYISEPTDDELQIHASGDYIMLDGSEVRIGDAGTPALATSDGDLFVEDDLEVDGIAQVQEYIKVGNPTEPTGVGVNDVMFYHVDFGTTQYWNYILEVCNNADGALWSINTDYTQFDNTGTTEHYRALHSPYIWMPGIIDPSKIRIEIDHDCSLENGYDGVYLECDENNDGTFNKITSWATYGYTSGVDGCDQSCNQPNTTAWTSSSFTGRQTSVSNAGAISGLSNSSWIRLRLVGMEDNSNGTGDYKAYDLWIYGDDVNFGSSGFEPGGIYAEGHIFAQSNSQIGDVAEYFPVKGNSVPGDLIAMDNSGSNLCYLSSKDNSELVIGVHSTAPSILVNNPNEGIPVALTGRVPVNVTNENGEIKPGDYLTASSTEGYAMKATKPCFVVGRAMENLNDKKGQVLCMIGTAWYNPNPVSEGVISGNSKIVKGQESFTVIDKRITQFSRVFVTMRGNPGAYYWINNVSDGSFEISFEKATLNDVNFDYLVNNASTAEEIKNTINNDIISKEKEVVEKEGCTTCGSKIVLIDNNGNEIQSMAISENPPSAPPDANKAWTWDTVNGFVELDVDFNKRVDAQRKNVKYQEKQKLEHQEQQQLEQIKQQK